jgi:hypothetical protein
LWLNSELFAEVNEKCKTLAFNLGAINAKYSPWQRISRFLVCFLPEHPCRDRFDILQGNLLKNKNIEMIIVEKNEISIF